MRNVAFFIFQTAILYVLWPSVTAAWAVFVLYRQADVMSWVSIVLSSCSFVLFPPYFLKNDFIVKTFSTEILEYSFGILVI